MEFRRVLFRSACGGRPFARNPALPAEAGAAHHARLAAAEGRADRDAGAVADRALVAHGQRRLAVLAADADADAVGAGQAGGVHRHAGVGAAHRRQLVDPRSEEHTSELPSLMSISYDV